VFKAGEERWDTPETSLHQSDADDVTAVTGRSAVVPPWEHGMCRSIALLSNLRGLPESALLQDA
jgi:hypothetical protein